MKKTTLAQIHCGSCTFLTRDKHFESPCTNLGKLPSSRACQSHIPDAFKLVNAPDHVDYMSSLSHVMSVLSVNELQVLGTLMIREKITRKHGFQFNQKVYVRIFGAGNSNFLSNFVVGYVLDATDEFVRIIGESGKVTMQVVNDRNGTTLYTVDRFESLRRSMIEKQALRDKDALKSKSGRAYDYIVPLDVAIKEDLIDNKKIRKSERDDLVNLARRIGSGVIRSKKSRSDNLQGKDGSVVIGGWE